MKRAGFTMIELVFVIVVLGILAAIAMPKFAATRDDAQIAKGRSDVAAIRAAIVNERQSRLLRGMSLYAEKLDDAPNNTDGKVLFNKNPNGGTLLQYGIVGIKEITEPTKKHHNNGHWIKKSDTSYLFYIMGNPVAFDYNSTTGTFNCDISDNNCKLLAH